MLARANADIASADEALAGVDLSSVNLDSFVSIASIQQTGESLNNSLPAIDTAIGHVNQAAAQVNEAAGLSKLPEGYRDYLDRKRDLAEVRLEQLVTLREMIESLRMLYQDGDVIFTAVEEMDRLWGQVEYYTQTVQNSPAESSAGLSQAAASMRQLKDQLDSRYAESGFDLLASLADSIEENALLADAARALADAVQAGDQAAAQQAAIAVENQILNTTDTSGFIDIWVRTSLKPDVRDFQDLQKRQEELDAEAAELFNNRS